MPIERVILHQAINQLPDNFLPDVANFIAFLQMKAQQKINIWAILSTNAGAETKYVDSHDLLEKAAKNLLDDYVNDKELTAFTSLDGEDLYG